MAFLGVTGELLFVNNGATASGRHQFNHTGADCARRCGGHSYALLKVTLRLGKNH